MTEKVKRPWIILITHGHFGKELIKSAELILGELKDIHCLSLIEEMDPMVLVKELSEILEEAPANSFLFTDLFGGTPSNISAKVAASKGYQVITGVNLPLLIEAEMVRYKGEEINAKELISSGKDSIKNLNEIMKERE